MLVKLEPSPYNVPPLIVVADKPPLTVKPVTLLIITLKVEPELSNIVNVLSLYVNPVVYVFSVTGRLRYVVAYIVLAVNPLVNIVSPVTVPPLNGRKSLILPIIGSIINVSLIFD
jgi:hypothetical protein